VLVGVAGALAGGLLVLVVALLGVWAYSAYRGVPGPGFGVLAGHLAAAAGAVGLQRLADRRAGRVSPVVAAAGVLGIFTLVCCTYWWA
jgi:hypothetical protein